MRALALPDARVPAWPIGKWTSERLSLSPSLSLRFCFSRFRLAVKGLMHVRRHRLHVVLAVARVAFSLSARPRRSRLPLFHTRL